jgi:hypothetical protein
MVTSDGRTARRHSLDEARRGNPAWTVSVGLGRPKRVERRLEDRLSITSIARDHGDGDDHVQDLLEREVDLTAEAVEMLWWGELGRPDEGLVFPGDGRDGYLVNGTILKRELYPAMKRPGISPVGPTGEQRTFHKLPPYVRADRARAWR